MYTIPRHEYYSAEILQFCKRRTEYRLSMTALNAGILLTDAASSKPSKFQEVRVDTSDPSKIIDNAGLLQSDRHAEHGCREPVPWLLSLQDGPE